MYRDSASGEMFRHATSMERVSALATTHPLVSTLNPAPENVHEDRVLDVRGLAISGEQSNFYLSLSLAACGKVIIVGISTYDVDSSVLALWWAPTGRDWIEAELEFARQVFFDLMELDSSSVCPVEEDKDVASALGGAASGAPVEAKFELVDLEDTGSSLGEFESDNEPTACEAECSGEDELEEEGPRGAASGALRGVVKQASLNAMSAEEQERVQARATQVHRQVHFSDLGHWPEDSTVWLCSPRLVRKRRRRISSLIHKMKDK